MCKYCSDAETLGMRHVPNKPLTMVSVEDKHLVIIDDFGLFDIPINFCPMCGERLESDT